MIDLRLNLDNFQINGLEIPNIYRDLFSLREEVRGLSYKKILSRYMKNGIDLNLWERKSVDYIGFELPATNTFPYKLYLHKQEREIELRHELSEQQLAEFLGSPEQRDPGEEEIIILYQYSKYELEFEFNPDGSCLNRINLIQREATAADPAYDHYFFTRWKFKMAALIAVNLLVYGGFTLTLGVQWRLLSVLWPALFLFTSYLVVNAGEVGYNSIHGRQRADRKTSPSKFWSCVDGRLLISCLGMCIYL